MNQLTGILPLPNRPSDKVGRVAQNAKGGQPLQEVLNELLRVAEQSSDLRAIRREDSRMNWAETLSISKQAPVEATHAYLDYQVAYFLERDANTFDFSFLLTNGDVPVALMFGLAATDEVSRRIVLGSPSRAIQIAFVESNPSNSCSSKLCNFLNSALLNGSVSKFFLQRPSTTPLGDLDASLSQSFACIEPNIRYMINPIDIFANNFLDLRRSYRSLVRSSRAKQLDVSVVSQDLSRRFRQFRELHREVSGRITRGERTWLLQLEALTSGDAFLVEVRKEGTLVGGAYISTSRDEALYGVGAYSRTLMKAGFPVGHVAQVEVIRHLANLGISRYLIGVQRDNANIHDSKLKGIDAFKRGFGASLEISLLFSSDIGPH